MPTIPSETLQVGSGGAFTAPGTVPIQDATGPQIQALGRSVETLGSSLGDIAATIEQDEAVARAQQGLNRFNTAISPLVADYMAATGEDATGDAPKQLLTKINEIKQSVSQSLGTDVQRGMFGDKANLRMVEIGRQTAGHYAAQVKAFRIGEADAASLMEAGAAVQTWVAGDERASRSHKAEAVKQARIVADGRGDGPKQTEERILARTTEIHAGIVGRLLDEGSPDKARDYWQGVDKAEVSPQERGRIGAAVRVGTMKQRAEDLAIEILAKATPEEIAGQVQGLAEALGMRAPGAAQVARRLGPEELRRRAFEILDEKDLPVEMADIVRDRIEFRVQERARAQAVDANTAVTRAETILSQNPGMAASMLPTSLQQELFRFGKWADILEFAEKTDYPNNLATWNEFQTMTDDELRKVDRFVLLDRIGTSMDMSNREKVMARWRNLQNEASGEDKSRLAWTDLVERNALSAGILKRTTPSGQPTSNNKEDWERVWRIQAEVERRLNDFLRASGGKQPTRDDMQGIVDDVFADHVYSYRGSDVPEAPISMLTRQELAEAKRVIGDVEIPAPVFIQLREWARQLGQPATDDELLQVWRNAGSPATIEALREGR